MSAGPKLAPGLVLGAPRSDGRSVAVVDGRGAVLLRPEAREVVEGLARGDGLEDIAARVGQLVGRAVTRDEVARLIEGPLSRSGLLEAPCARTNRRPGPLALGVRLPVLNGERLFWLCQLLARVATPRAVTTLAGASVAAALVVTGAAWSRGLLGDGLRLLPAATLAFAPGILLHPLATVVHEFGHAAAAIRLGAKPGELGVGVYLGRRVLYVRLDDVHRLAARDRVTVDLAGVAAQGLVTIPICVLALIDSHDVTLSLALGMAGVLVANFNPVLKLDGYWVLSDLLDQPNLHATVARTVTSRTWARTQDRPARVAVMAWLTIPGMWMIGGVALFPLIGWPLLEAWPAFAAMTFSSVSQAWASGDALQALGALWRVLVGVALPLSSVGYAAVQGARWVVQHWRRRGL